MFEYKVEISAEVAVEKRLNELGKNRWRLIQLTHQKSERGLPIFVTLYMIREKLREGVVIP